MLVHSVMCSVLHAPLGIVCRCAIFFFSCCCVFPAAARPVLNDNGTYFVYREGEVCLQGHSREMAGQLRGNFCYAENRRSIELVGELMADSVDACFFFLSRILEALAVVVFAGPAAVVLPTESSRRALVRGTDVVVSRKRELTYRKQILSFECKKLRRRLPAATRHSFVLPKKNHRVGF